MYGQCWKTRTNLRSHIKDAFDKLFNTPEALEKILEADLDSDCLEDGTEDSFDTNHMEEEHPDTKLDQDGLNMQIENFNKI